VWSHWLYSGCHGTCFNPLRSDVSSQLASLDGHLSLKLVGSHLSTLHTSVSSACEFLPHYSAEPAPKGSSDLWIPVKVLILNCLAGLAHLVPPPFLVLAAGHLLFCILSCFSGSCFAFIGIMFSLPICPVFPFLLTLSRALFSPSSLALSQFRIYPIVALAILITLPVDLPTSTLDCFRRTGVVFLVLSMHLWGLVQCQTLNICQINR
jgi:hypothetical protein